MAERTNAGYRDRDDELLASLTAARYQGDWADDALCSQTDPEMFFPEKGGTVAPAKAVCGRCDVREECLQWALDNDERVGVWGGMSYRERRLYARTQVRRVA